MSKKFLIYKNFICFMIDSIVNSFNGSISDTFEGDFFDFSTSRDVLGKLQKLTANVAATCLVAAAALLTVIGGSYLEDKFIRFISFNRLTTLSASLITVGTPYLLTGIKVTLFIAAGAMACWTLLTVSKGVMDVYSDWRDSSAPV